MKLSAIIAVLMTGIGVLVFGFGGEFYSAPFFILALILFFAAWMQRGPERYIKPTELGWEELWGVDLKPERKGFKPKEWPADEIDFNKLPGDSVVRDTRERPQF